MSFHSVALTFNRVNLESVVGTSGVTAAAAAAAAEVKEEPSHQYKSTKANMMSVPNASQPGNVAVSKVPPLSLLCLVGCARTSVALVRGRKPTVQHIQRTFDR